MAHPKSRNKSVPSYVDNRSCQSGGLLNMLQAAIWQHHLPNAQIVVVALVMAVSGCASTGPNAPQTSNESAAGGVGGTLGAVGGAVGGAALGAVYGIAYCGPAFFICSPVFAAIFGVAGAGKGGELGAQVGVKSARIASAPESPESASEPSAPKSSGPSMVLEPAQAPGYDKMAPGDSEKTVDLPVSAPQLSPPLTREKLEAQTALVDPTRTSVRTDTAADTQKHLPTGIEVKTRTLTGEDVVNHFSSLRNVDVKAPPDLMSLTFQGGNRFEILYWTPRDASGVRQTGTYSVRPDQNVVCFSVPAEQRAGGFGVASEWMSDCFRVSQTDEKAYSLRTLKGDYGFSYAVR